MSAQTCATGRNWITALDGWGQAMPDWIDALARECDKPKTSQRKVAALLGVSVTAVNLLLKNKYAPRDHRDMEARVRAILMVTMIACPVLGVMGRADCLKEQRKALVTCNPVSVQLFHACRGGCRYFEGEKTE